MNSGKIREAIEALWQAFTWHNSPQGHNFWSNVVQELEKFAKTAEESE